jgi:ATP adenylyltransferase
MKRIFAPWRMGYINSKKPDRCIFCRIFEEGISEDNLALYRSDKVLIMMNMFPYTNGHILVTPKKHTGSLIELKPDEYSAFCDVLRNAAEALRSALKPDGLNVGFNIGRIAGAGIDDHIHAHIVPRWSGDTNFMPVINDVRVIPQALNETYKVLSPFFSKIGEHI